MSELSNTQFFQVGNAPQIQAKEILEIVYTYITSHNGARSLIMKMERDELVEEMLKSYIEHHSWE